MAPWGPPEGLEQLQASNFGSAAIVYGCPYGCPYGVFMDVCKDSPKDVLAYVPLEGLF